MLFTVIALILLVGAWLSLSMISWIALSLRRRARGALWAAPWAAGSGVGAGIIAPLAGLNDEIGLGVSMIAALVGSSIGCALAFRIWDRLKLGDRFASWARRER